MTVLAELTRIVQSAAEAESVSEQVSIIVDSIQSYMNVDVCSLYLQGEGDSMILAASHGLRASSVGSVRIPAGAGLVGQIVKSCQPFNIAEAPSHPAFYYVAETDEAQFHSFAGVPLVRAGKVIGVLAVQCQRARLLSGEEMAFLVTLGAQLALVVSGDTIETLYPRTGTHRIPGIKGASGVGIGQVYLCASVDLALIPDQASEDVEAECAQWRALVESVQADVRNEQSSLGSDLSREVSAVFDAYQMLLSDRTLVQGVEQAIRNGNHLPGALRSVIHHYASLFLAMDDPYLRARHEDIIHLGNKLYSAWKGARANESHSDTGGPVVLVGAQIGISDIAAVPRERLVGILCYQGSTLSHSAVLANALGVPAVMGIGEQKGLKEGTLCIVDGNTGQCIFDPDSTLVREYRRLAREERQLATMLADLRDEAALTPDGERIQLFANSGLLADLSPGLASGAEGLGLYRTEIPFMISEAFPSEEEQVAIYSQVLSAYAGKPVNMRILDIGGDKPLPYFPIHEENPALGWRGIRFCLDNSSLLMTQVRAMLRAAADKGNLRILLPMVSARAELESFYSVFSEACSQLEAEGHSIDRPPVGVMIEVPSAISQIPAWSDLIDFVSIGTNDLSQYLLAVDRNNPRVASLYDSLHPAVLIEIDRTLQAAGSHGLPVSVCGEMASDPLAALLLIGLGVRTLSMSAAQLPRIKWMIRKLPLARMEVLAHNMLKQRDSAAIRSLVSAELKSMGLEDLAH